MRENHVDTKALASCTSTSLCSMRSGMRRLIATCIVLLYATVGSALLVYPATPHMGIWGRHSCLRQNANKCTGVLAGWQMIEKDDSATSQIGEFQPLSSKTTATGTPVARSPLGNAFPAQRPLLQAKKWQGATGTSFLPEETIERAKAGNPVEQAKMAKDATTIFNSVYEYAAAIRSGEMDWEDVEKADFNTRLKWLGLVHRDKRTPGKFMMRLRIPNGITNADLMRFYADVVEPYGTDLGVIDITTRQNIQLRGVVLEDAPGIIDGLHARGQTSFHSALDNVRNMVGSPLAGIDDQVLAACIQVPLL